MGRVDCLVRAVPTLGLAARYRTHPILNRLHGLRSPGNDPLRGLGGFSAACNLFQHVVQIPRSRCLGTSVLPSHAVCDWQIGVLMRRRQLGLRLSQFAEGMGES